MIDVRVTKLAEQLIHHSTRLQKGEKVLIEVFGLAGELELAKALVQEAYRVGALPFVQVQDVKVVRELLKKATPEQLDMWMKWDRTRMEQMDAYIAVRGGDNPSELSDVPEENMKNYLQYYQRKVHSEVRVPRTKWVVLRYPTPSMAQAANMSTEAFEDFYFSTCIMNYQKMGKALQPLKELMERTDQVHITGPGTDLTLSIKGMPIIPCFGHYNIPDGEIFTAPIRDSVNGKISYNAPSLYLGTVHDNIVFEIENGKIVKATSNDPDKINKVLDTDEGARYFGEFAIGVNPYVMYPMKDILFDEKIAGSFHFTPGNAYDEAFNGNHSSIHWDLVCIQRPEYGGGEMYFDGVLVRKDGLFVLPELQGLNPENLIKSGSSESAEVMK